MKSAKANHSKDLVQDLQERLNRYERDKQILLTLSNDITKVREKDDLVEIISSALKRFFHFTHAVIALVDKEKKSCFPFLVDPKAHPGNDPAVFRSLLATQYPFQDAVFNLASGLDFPTCYVLESLVGNPGIPAFVKMNYEHGMREVMVMPLKRNMETFGFLLVYSDSIGSFSDNFKDVLQGIAPHLSNAVSNILANQELSYKEYVNEILLSLSNDMVTVRSRADLLNVINFGLKKLIYFTHSLISVLDETGETYHAFLTDSEYRAKAFPEYAEMVATPNPVADDIYDVAVASDTPVVFDMESRDLSDVPLWFRVYRQAGASEMLVKALPGEGPKHCLFLFSDQPNHFDEKAIQIIERISSQLATAASNISANETLLLKEKEKSFLLEFSHDIAAVRTRNDLSVAIHNSLKKISEIRAYFIRIINDDGATMSPFMHDKEVFYITDPKFRELLATKIPVDAGITARVLAGSQPVLIDFEEEIRAGNTDHYIEFWKGLGPKKAAFRRMTGTPLRLGDDNFGVLWIITPKINTTILEGISAQISVAISNVKSNEELERRQAEKSALLTLSGEIAALRNRDDLTRVVNTLIKEMFSIREFGFERIDDDGKTYSAFVLNLENAITDHADFDRITSARYSVTDPIFSSMINSEDPVIFDVDKLATEPGMPAYVGFWKSVGLHRVLGMALRVGGKNIGCAFLHIDGDGGRTNKTNMVKAVCAQLSVAISNIIANEQLLAYKQLLEIENNQLKEQIKTVYNFNEIVGNGPAMQKVYQLMSLVANSNSTVLLLGETGTGKELIARAIHDASSRKDRLMIKVNCAAIAANLIESELFGHEKGSFTGAIERRIGKFELANNGTLFLDEIGEMPLELQVKLLRAIQEREIERVGGKRPIKIDVRIIAATNRNLQKEVNEGRFRSDLYYRLNVFPIELPPLRDRKEDIEPLANYFLMRYATNTGRKVTGMSPKVLKDLKTYQWPGNVRELEHLIERSVLLTQDKVLTEVRLPHGVEERGANPDFADRTLHQLERDYIIEVLRRCNGKVAGKGGAAELLELPSTTLHSKIRKLGIQKRDYYSD